MRVALALFLLIAGGCGGEAGDGPTGAPGVPQRIVSLTPALTEILFALELGNRVVGVTEYCDYPPEARERPRVGGYVNPSVEAIVDLQPDLVLVSPNTGNRDAALSVQRAGLRLEVVAAEDLDDTFDAIRTVARLAGVQANGDRLVAEIERRIAAAAERVRENEPVPVLYCLQLEPIIAAGAATLPGELLERAGGRNVIEADGYPRLGIETVVEIGPAVILQARMDSPDPGSDAAIVEHWRRWPAIPAVRDARVHVFDGSTSLRPGPRIAEAVEQLAAFLHPGAAESGE